VTGKRGVFQIRCGYISHDSCTRAIREISRSGN